MTSTTSCSARPGARGRSVTIKVPKRVPRTWIWEVRTRPMSDSWSTAPVARVSSWVPGSWCVPSRLSGSWMSSRACARGPSGSSPWVTTLVIAPCWDSSVMASRAAPARVSRQQICSARRCSSPTSSTALSDRTARSRRALSSSSPAVAPVACSPVSVPVARSPAGAPVARSPAAAGGLPCSGSGRWGSMVRAHASPCLCHRRRPGDLCDTGGRWWCAWGRRSAGGQPRFALPRCFGAAGLLGLLGLVGLPGLLGLPGSAGLAR